MVGRRIPGPQRASGVHAVCHSIYKTEHEIFIIENQLCSSGGQPCSAGLCGRWEFSCRLLGAWFVDDEDYHMQAVLPFVGAYKGPWWDTPSQG